MNRKKSFATFLLIGSLSAIIFGQGGQAGKSSLSEDVLHRSISVRSFEYLTTTSAFRDALSTTSVPGGIVKVSSCEEDPILQTWRPPGSSLRDGLDTIVKTDPQYRWQLEDGVINLLPADSEPSLLQVRVKQFHVKNATSVYLAYGKLFALPEVKKAIVELNLNDSFERIQGGSSTNLNRAKFSVHCKGVTLREALNAIVRAHGQAVWAYKEWHCDGMHRFSIEFIVQ